MPCRDGELLSAYLCRVGRRHGLDASRFAAFFLGTQAIWARDIDRGESVIDWQGWSGLFGIEAKQLQAMTFRAWTDLVASAIGRAATPSSPRGDRADGARAGSSHQPPPAFVHWLNAAGIYHRVRYRHALQYCPQCIAGRDFIDRRWRLSFVVRCPVHHTPMADACPHCDSPFVPHRASRWPYRCHACRRELASNPMAQGGPPIVPAGLDRHGDEASVLELQARLDALLAASERGGRGRDEALAELVALRWVAGVLLCGASRARALETLGLDPACAAQAGRTLEVSRIAWRTTAMRFLARLLKRWPQSFRDCARVASVTQRTARHLGTQPPWLAEEITRLPKGRINRSNGQGLAELTGRLLDLRHRRPLGWRGEHAALMLRAASRAAPKSRKHPMAR